MKDDDEIRDIIDENNNVIGQATRKEMREKHLLHRGAIAIVKNSKGEIFLHRRSSTKDIYPNVYDILCGGGVESGETYDDAVKRELEEEVGIKDAKVEFLFDFRLKSKVDNCIARVYLCVFDGEIIMNKEEMTEGFFVTVEKLKELIKTEDFCPEAIKIFEKWEEMN